MYFQTYFEKISQNLIRHKLVLESYNARVEFVFSATYIWKICPTRGRSVTVFTGPPNNKQDKNMIVLYRPGNIAPLRHLENCRIKFDPRAIAIVIMYSNVVVFPITDLPRGRAWSWT